jgi:hypothetical protein
VPEVAIFYTILHFLVRLAIPLPFTLPPLAIAVGIFTGDVVARGAEGLEPVLVGTNVELLVGE